jgi:hypothetical protein
MFTTKCKCGEEITFAIEMAVMTKFCPRCGSIVEVRNGKASVTSSGVPPQPSHAPAPEIPQASGPKAPHFAGPKPATAHTAEPMERPRRAEPPRVHTPPLAQTQPFAASRPQYPAQQPPQPPPALQRKDAANRHEEKPDAEPHPEPEHPKPREQYIVETGGEAPHMPPPHAVPAEAATHKPESEWTNIPVHVIDEDKEGGHHAPPKADAKVAPYTATPHPYQQPHVKPAAPPPPMYHPGTPQPQAPHPPIYPPKAPQPHGVYSQDATKSSYDRYTFTPAQDAPKTSGCLVAIIIAVIVCVLFFVLLSATNTKSEPPKKNPTTTPTAESYKGKVGIVVASISGESDVTISFAIVNGGGYALDRLSFDFHFLDGNGHVMKTERVVAITPSANNSDRDGPVKGLAGGRDFTMKKKFTGVPGTWSGKYEIEIVDLHIR